MGDREQPRRAGVRDPVLEFAGVGHGFGADPLGLLRDVSLRVWRGEVVAVRGDNGGGKSTLLRFPLGIGRPRVGRVSVAGRPASARDHHPGIGFVGGLPQADADLPLPPELPIGLYLRTVFAALAEAGANARFARDAADALQLDGPETRGKRFGQLSKGWQLRYQWFPAVAKPADLLLMDEPFDGLDDSIKPVAFDLLRGAVARHRSGVLLVSHHYHEIARVADRVFELAGKTLHPRGTRPYDAVVVADGRRGDYRGLTGRELLDVLADPFLAGRVADLEVRATAADARKEAG